MVLLILGSVEKVILTLADVYDLLTGLEKMGYFTDIPLEPDEGMDFERVDTGKGMELEVQDLSFQFSDSDQPTLRDINFKVKSGEKICIAGYNGSGKSTLVQVISGLMLNYKGTISYNNAPMFNFNLRSLRSYIGDHGSQEDVFQGTLWENICLGHEDIDFQQIVWATRQVGLENFVKSLPKGYDTLLLPGGRNLPQSVQTKILLARSIVSQPRLLALEEFLNRLQPEERERMSDMLTDRSQPWTLVAVSNDPLLEGRCERIILMENGKIIAEGNYEELRDSPHFERIFQMSTPNGQAIQPKWQEKK